jgi:hypothetical protein
VGSCDTSAVLALGIAATLGVLLAAAPGARAESDCKQVFERWAKISSAHIVPNAGGGRGACVPSEDVRIGLLDGLARARGVCVGSDASQEVQETRKLLNINQSFVAALGVCPGAGGGTAGAGEGWVTKAAPPEKPRIAAPPPVHAPAAAPRAAVRTPPPAPQRPAAAAPLPPLPTPPPAAAPVAVMPALPPPKPPCLDIVPAQSVPPAQTGNFALINRHCRGFAVLAVIETQTESGEVACAAHTVGQGLAVRAPLATPPRINYECVLGQGDCTKQRLENMFPECDW